MTTGSRDLFVGATPAEVREVFRRINSYTVPLNAEEQRHATYQGPFKWFIASLSKDLGDGLIEIGAFNQKQLVMAGVVANLTALAAGGCRPLVINRCLTPMPRN